MHLHQGTQSNSGYSKENGYPDSSLSRRRAHHEQHLPGCLGRHPNPEVHSRESRISDKHGKIHFHPCAGHRIPGNPCKLHKHEVSPPRRKSCCNSEGMSPSGKQSSCLKEPTLAYNREVAFLQNCSSSSPPLLSRD